MYIIRHFYYYQKQTCSKYMHQEPLTIHHPPLGDSLISIVVVCGFLISFLYIFKLLNHIIWHLWEDFITIAGLSALPQEHRQKHNELTNLTNKCIIYNKPSYMRRKQIKQFEIIFQIGHQMRKQSHNTILDDIPIHDN